MECYKANELMMGYMDSTLTEDQASKLNQHLRTCASCKEDFLVYDNIMKEFSKAEVIAAPPGFEESVMKKIQSIEFKRNGLFSADSFVCVVWGMFSVLFGLGFILFLYKDAVLETLAAIPYMSAFIATMLPISEFVTSLSNSILLSGEVMLGIITSSRYIVLGIILCLATVQYAMYRKEKLNKHKAG